VHKQSTARKTNRRWTLANEERQPAEPALMSPDAMNLTVLNRVESIVLPTDFSNADNQLLHRAVLLAQLFDTKITLLHVIDINDPRWSTYCGCATDFMRQVQTEAESHMHELLMWFANEPVEIKPVTLEGLPCSEILQRLPPSSLLLLRKPVPKPFWRLFSKRTAQRLLDEAQCALMVCPK
jgi:hypothetical protein